MSPWYSCSEIGSPNATGVVHLLSVTCPGLWKLSILILVNQLSIYLLIIISHTGRLQQAFVAYHILSSLLAFKIILINLVYVIRIIISCNAYSQLHGIYLA